MILIGHKKRQFITILSVICLFGCQSNIEQNKQANTMAKAQFADIAASKTMHYFCELDDKLKMCMNLNAGQCKDIIREVSPYCISRVMSEMPETISEKNEFVKYSQSMTTCIGMQMLIQAKMDYFEVDRCFRDHK